MSKLDLACSTETEHDWLKDNRWECIAENEEFDCQYGDIFIWGRKGYSAGEFGHTGIFLDTEGTIIHCNYPDDGIGIDEHDDLHAFSGAEEKELFKKGTRVRVYEKVNGYSRIGSPQSYQWI